MKNESLIHLRVGYENALESKKDVLFAEMNLLTIAKIVKTYHGLRVEELELKAKLHRKLKDLEKNVKKLETILPKVVMPKILKKDEEEEVVEKKEKKVKGKKVEAKVEAKEEKKYDSSLESQLQAIQNKLMSLQK